eukprot:TRINITY_DN4858_c0_g1_i1.p1 TRINITY_DN4858_c0_g1~~TRINITY_DN4858_c0_g1_i1.p1  ORF type:complete len:251 (-),score=78.65 TRINITY_DN4858_c0_g1_i1:63-815(-)
MADKDTSETKKGLLDTEGSSSDVDNVQVNDKKKKNKKGKKNKQSLIDVVFDQQDGNSQPTSSQFNQSNVHTPSSYSSTSTFPMSINGDDEDSSDVGMVDLEAGRGGKKKKGKKGKKEKEVVLDENGVPKVGLPDLKSLLSNERNFLSWVGTSFSLGAIGTAIITFFGGEDASLLSGIFLWVIAIAFIIYSTWQFRARARAIQSRSRGPFDDQRGPLALVVMSIMAVSIFLIFFIIVRPTANIHSGGDKSS